MNYSFSIAKRHIDHIVNEFFRTKEAALDAHFYRQKKCRQKPEQSVSYQRLEAKYEVALVPGGMGKRPNNPSPHIVRNTDKLFRLAAKIAIDAEGEF